MKRTAHIFLIFTLLSILLVHQTYAVVAQSPVSAKVDRNSLPLGESLILTILIDGSRASEPEIPVMDGFQVMSSGKSSQFSIVNGKMSSQVSYRYTLRPTREGQLTIPAINVEVDGQVYATQPIKIEVLSGTNPLQPVQPIQPGSTISPDDLQPGVEGEDAFVEASVDNPEPYLGEQILYTFRFFRAVTFFEQPSYQPPSFKGFWSETDTEQFDYDVQVAGRHYQVVELQRVLIPTSVGDFTIEPARLSIPASFFMSDIDLESDPIKVTVKSLPEPEPDGFRGAVGQFSIAAQVDNDQVMVNEPLTLKVELSGVGNLSTLSEIEMPEVDGWRAFDATIKVDADVQDGKLQGSLISEQLLVPNEAGDYKIPAVEFVYFDPQTESYQTVKTEAIAVSVAPGNGDEEVAATMENISEPSEQVSGKSVNEIRYIKAVPDELKKTATDWYNSPIYWVLLTLAPIVLVVDWLLRRKTKYMRENPERVRASRAAKKAQRALREIETERSNAVDSLNQILHTFLDERLNHSVRGMRNEELNQFLIDVGISQELTKEALDILQWSEMERYGAVKMDNVETQSMIKRTMGLIHQIEEELKQKK